MLAYIALAVAMVHAPSSLVVTDVDSPVIIQELIDAVNSNLYAKYMQRRTLPDPSLSNFIDHFCETFEKIESKSTGHSNGSRDRWYVLLVSILPRKRVELINENHNM